MEDGGRIYAHLKYYAPQIVAAASAAAEAAADVQVKVC